MAEQEEKKGFFGKIVQAVDMRLEKYITDTKIDLVTKAKTGLMLEDDEFYRRSYYQPLLDAFYEGAGFKDKPSRIDFQVLKLMSYRDTIVASIIQTRLNQVSLFSRPQPDRYSEGFVVKRKRPLEKDLDEETLKRQDTEDREIIDKIQDFILNCGFAESRPATEIMTFEMLLRRLTRDRLTYDQVAIENVLDNGGKLHHILPVDAGTIRYASVRHQAQATLTPNFDTGSNIIRPDTPEEVEEARNDEFTYVQVIDQRVVRGFTRDDLIFRLGNPVNDIYTNGYSIGELELLVTTITSHLQAETYNRLFFTHGHVTKGILHFQADIPQRKLKALRQQWDAQVTGNLNSWRTPIFAGTEKIDWIPLNQATKDVEYMNWMNYLIKIACAIFCISPEEIGFDIGRDAGTPGGMFQSANETRIKHSKDKGLRPLLRFIEDCINQEIVNKLNPGFCLQFVGLDAETKEQAINRGKIEAGYLKTIDELRVEAGLEILGKERGGHLILDPTYIGWLGQQQMQQQQQGAPGQEAPPGESGDFGEGEGGGEMQNYSEGEEQPEQQPEEQLEGQSEQPGQEKVERSLKKSKKSPTLIKVEWYKK